MVRWSTLSDDEPEFANRLQTLFDAGRHKTIATLRADGSPRISGIECRFTGGELTFGSMPGSRKLDDLRRDPRFALHGPTFHPEPGKESEWPGEAKLSGRAVATDPPAPDEMPEEWQSETDEGPDGEFFVADISEAVITGLNPEATLLVVEWWTPTGGLQRFERG